MPDVEVRSLAVLLAEDNLGDRRLTEIALREAAAEAGIRCTVEAADSLAGALRRVGDTTAPVDAILLDLGLPDARGLEGLLALRDIALDAAIVVLTGLSDLNVATEALKGGASDYLEKSELQPRTLLRSVRYSIERRKSAAEMARLARSDPLTGLLNRRAFFEQLELALTQARRSELACGVILFDIDRFKEINDLYGHRIGDLLLLEVSQRIRAQLRESDAIARIGGDEFAIVATNLYSAGAAMEIAEKISRAICAIDQVDGVHLEVSISVGISVFPMDVSSGDVLVAHADMAMYKSKVARRGSINFFDAQLDAVVKARHALKRSMPEDILAGRFYLLFQPIVDAGNRRLVGAEALARWRDANNKVVGPSEFIPIAEETGSIGVLGRCLLQEACQQIHTWSEFDKAVVPISMNISAAQCRDPAFAVGLIGTLERLQVPGRLINVEMTESTIFKSLEVIQRNLDLIKAYGMGVHIDDFGTGYSSLSLLRDLPLDAVKIDRSFISDIGKSSGAEVIVQAIVDLAKKLGFATIAEGVETEAQASSLRDFGVDCLQGYYFSQPVPGAQLANWLAKSAPHMVA